MKTIIYLGIQKSGSSREAVSAAERLGFYTVVLTDQPRQREQRTEYSDVHLMILCDLGNMDELRNHIRNLQIKGLEIASIISFIDPHGYTASLLAEEFGIGCFTPQAIANMQDKVLSRQLVAPLPYAPAFTVLRENFAYSSIPDAIKGRFPFIIKSPNSAGSKDVFKVTSEREFEQLSKKISQRYPGVPILVEEFLDGPQYLVEVVVYQNQIHIIAIFQQEITFQQRFIITGYTMLINRPVPFFDDLRKAVETIVKAHGMEMGTCHLEIRQVPSGWKLIEINPRISGGGMNRLIECGLGYNLVEETIKMAVGQKPDLQPKKLQPVFAQYITVNQSGILEKVTGKIRALQCPGTLEVYIKPRKGASLTPPLSMGHRYAYVIAKGESEENAKENAKNAASQIQFHLWTNEKTDGNDDSLQENLLTTKETPAETDFMQGSSLTTRETPAETDFIQEDLQSTEETPPVTDTMLTEQTPPVTDFMQGSMQITGETADETDFIQKIWQTLDAMKNNIGAIYQWLLNLAKYVWNWGVNLITCIANGFCAMVGKVLEEVTW